MNTELVLMPISDCGNINEFFNTLKEDLFSITNPLFLYLCFPKLQPMIKHINFLFFLVFSFNNTQALPIPEWGPTGHRTIGAIAQKHLNKKTNKEIEKILQGESLAMVSTYGDEIKSDSRYKKFDTWHYVNFPFDTKYKDSKKNPKGDIVMGINYCISILRNNNSSEDDKNFYLKFLVHLIGDLHQPLHVGRADDRGGNDIKVKWFYKNSNLHRVWDSDMIESWNMSYTELALNTQKMSNQQVNEIKRGDILDWTYESQKLAQKVYNSAKNGDKLSYKYSYENFSTVRKQIQKAGIRLAKILNDIYS